jgi:hypothetical protein
MKLSCTKGFIILEGIIVFCPLSLKNESKPCAFGISRGKIGDFKSPESENDKTLDMGQKVLDKPEPWYIFMLIRCLENIVGLDGETP